MGKSRKSIGTMNTLCGLSGLKAHIYVSISDLQEKKMFLNIVLKDYITENCYDNLSGYDYTLVVNPPSALELYRYFDELRKMLPSLSYKVYILGEEIK